MFEKEWECYGYLKEIEILNVLDEIIEWNGKLKFGEICDMGCVHWTCYDFINKYATWNIYNKV